MVDEGGHADDHLGFDFVDQAHIAVGAHGLAAAGAEAEGAEAEAGVVGLPEGEVRGVGEQVEVLPLRPGIANLHQALAGGTEDVEVVGAVEEWHRIGRATGGAGQEQRAELAGEVLRHRCPPA